ncbi:tRNA (adenine(22)-N(1))-methyltransferase TrmK [Halobacillus litoralis]|uniref:tRNA (adenine(22)-N(1))-methyltransferase n=1 Tax=Halobacillus litoralis TaxID=45668 RepID=UPI001CD22B46|nr:tRNA (adenine(22)-N(1))-methyltransferase TrmK [Halobacillus litoralis]MCA0970057.1 tRNA (adenine(22)-N(1))-methyltransferase TrmK [Halobacillus litoralis]
MNVNQLSKRLQTVADYLPEGAHFADIGSDHAYLPCYVCMKDPDAKAVAGEVNQGPLSSAEREVASHGLQDRIDTRLGNGLDVVKQGEVSQVTIAGMGGPLIRDILDQGKEKLSTVDRLIVQPNIDARALRRWFLDHGYELVAEEIIEEKGHIYEVLVADKGDSLKPYTKDKREQELWFGPFLMKNKGDVFQAKWKEELEKKQYVLAQMKKAQSVDEDKMEQLNKEIDWLEEVLAE